MYVAVHGDERLPAKSLMLKRVLPMTQLPEEAVDRVCRSLGWPPDELEESMRVRSVEWELLPLAVQNLIRDTRGLAGRCRGRRHLPRAGGPAAAPLGRA